MNGRLYKNIQNRTLFKKYEMEKRFYKIITRTNDNLDTKLCNNINRKISKFPLQASQSHIRNLCFLTEKARSTYRDFRLNRNMIKILSSKKLLQGLKRAS